MGSLNQALHWVKFFQPFFKSENKAKLSKKSLRFIFIKDVENKLFWKLVKMKTLQELPRNLPNIGSLIHSNPLWIEARDEIWNEINNSNSCFVAKSSKSSETGGLECKLKCHHHLFVIAAFSTKAIIWSKPEEPWSIWKVHSHT